jgi:hypothetical protein
LTNAADEQAEEVDELSLDVEAASMDEGLALEDVAEEQDDPEDTYYDRDYEDDRSDRDDYGDSR